MRVSADGRTDNIILKNITSGIIPTQCVKKSITISILKKEDKKIRRIIEAYYY